MSHGDHEEMNHKEHKDHKDLLVPFVVGRLCGERG